MFVNDETQFLTHRDPLCKTISLKELLLKFNETSQVHFSRCFTFITSERPFRKRPKKSSAQVPSRVNSKCFEDPDECELEYVK